EQHAEALAIEEISYANSAASDFVFVRRPDAPGSSSDRNAILASFRHLLHKAVEGKDHVGTVANEQVAANLDPGALECFHFIEQRARIDHHAIADNGLYPAENTTRDQLQDIFPIANKDRVAGIMATLVSRDNIEAIREKVDNFAFSLIAPLRAKHNDI